MAKKARKKEFSALSDQVRKRPGAAEEIEARKHGIRAAMRLNEVREQRRQTQAGLAALLETTQANISRMERSDNLYLRTLNEYIVGLGGRLEINAVFEDDVVPIGLIDRDRDREREHA